MKDNPILAIALVLLALAVLTVVLVRPAAAGAPTDAACIGKLEPSGYCVWRVVDEPYNMVCYVAAEAGVFCAKYR